MRVLPARDPRRAPSRRGRTGWLIAVCVALGLALRLILLVDSGWRYDYDEGMVGLQALRILRGARPVFHPGQPYLAALESYAVAALFDVFGPSAITLKLVPWLLAGLYIATTGWIGWRAFNSRVGALGALLAALAPLYLLVVGTKTWGATAETLVLGNLAFLATATVVNRAGRCSARERALVALGLVSGIAFWVSWLIAFYAVPILIIIAWQGRDVLRRAGLWAGLAFLAGSSPLWIYNVQHDFATFTYLFRDQGNVWDDLWPVLQHLNNDLAPRVVSGDPQWRLLSWDAIWYLQIVYQGGLVGLVAWSWRGPWPNHSRPARQMLALFALGLPTIYVLSGYSGHALNEFDFDATGRYVLMVHSVLPIGVAALADRLIRWRHGLRLPAAALLASVMCLNVLGAARANPVHVFTSPYYTRQPATLEPLIDYLDAQQIRHVWTDVGVAHVLMFETRERILAADWYDIYGAQGLVRFPEVPRAIYAADRVAFVEVILPGQRDTPFEQAFKQTGVPHTVARVTPDLLVIIPLAPLDPALVGDGLGYQF